MLVKHVSYGRAWLHTTSAYSGDFGEVGADIFLLAGAQCETPIPKGLQAAAFLFVSLYESSFKFCFTQNPNASSSHFLITICDGWGEWGESSSK